MSLSRRTLTTLALSVGVATVATLLYVTSDTLYQIMDHQIHGPEKARNLLKLRRIRSAGFNFLVNLNAAERDCRAAVRDKKPLEMALRNKILGLYVDLDYIFKHLDEVEGDQSIKTQRKLLVGRLKTHETRVELLVELVKTCKTEDITA
jgi:hypothetical protein